MKQGASLTLDTFWHGSPLLLNVTTLLAIGLFIAATIYFTYHHFKAKKQKEAARTEIQFKAANSQDIITTNNKLNMRPLAILALPTEDGGVGIAGDVNLLFQLPHITEDVIPSIEGPSIALPTVH